MSLKQKLILLSCGSYNPITFMHLRIFELAKDYFNNNGQFEVIRGIISPVHNNYKKKGLISSIHRNKMVELSLKDSNWIEIDTWETEQQDWSFTLSSLTNCKEKMSKKYGDDIRVMLLCGADLLESFNVPNLWRDDHVYDIASKFGLACINRAGSDAEKFIYEHNTLYKFRQNIHLITNWIQNDISSTKIRRAISRNESVKYLISNEIIDYIKENNLYN